MTLASHHCWIRIPVARSAQRMYRPNTYYVVSTWCAYYDCQHTGRNWSEQSFALLISLRPISYTVQPLLIQPTHRLGPDIPPSQRNHRQIDLPHEYSKTPRRSIARNLESVNHDPKAQTKPEPHPAGPARQASMALGGDREICSVLTAPQNSQVNSPMSLGP